MHHFTNPALPCLALLAVVLTLEEQWKVDALTALEKRKNGAVESRGLYVPIMYGDLNKSNSENKLPVKPKQEDDDEADASATEDSDVDNEKPDPTPKGGKKKDKKGKKKDGKWGRRFRRLFSQLPKWVRYTVLVCCGVGLLAILIGITKCYKRYRY